MDNPLAKMLVGICSKGHNIYLEDATRINDYEPNSVTPFRCRLCGEMFILSGRTAGIKTTSSSKSFSLRRFYLYREVDVTGVSGTDIVAEGIVFVTHEEEDAFPDGKVVIHWLGQHSSLVIWDSLDDAMAIHGHVGN